MGIVEEANRCLKCKVPKCKQFCPIDTPIPEIMKLFESGNIREAGEILFKNNPLSAITAIICPHEKNCNGHCVLGIKGKPVEFFKVEEYISGFYLRTFDVKKPELNGHRVAVIGAGPSGITMSLILAQKGYKVTLIESRQEIGGVLRYGIPDFRLPKDIIDRYGEILEKLGVYYKPNTFIGSNLNIEDMFVDGYDAVFVSVGTARPNKLGLLGETLGNVHYAIDYLKSPDSYRLGKKVLVIGAGNVAIDAARMAVRKIGGGTITLINNRREEDMTGNQEEIKMAKIDGVNFIHQKQTVQLKEDGAVVVDVNVSVGENGLPIYEEDFTKVQTIPADTIIVAIGQGPQAAAISNTKVAKTQRGLFSADENGRTTENGVFAAGDVVTGPKTVVEAVAFTKRVAEAIDEYCNSLNKKAR